MFVFSDRGTPYSIRHLSSYSGHTYKFTKKDGSFKYVRLTFQTDQGVKSHTNAEATRLAGENPDSHAEDLYNAIDRGDYPSWTLYVQVMEPKDAETYRWNIFDMTKVWPHADYPLQPVGKLTLNRNPENYFADIEPAAFSPSTMVPGIAPSADPMLQARMFAYPDAARYRLGVNYQQLPCNRARSPVFSPYERDGFATVTSNYGSAPNYVNSIFQPLTQTSEPGAETLGLDWGQHEEWTARMTSYTSEVTDEDFEQARALWRVLGNQEGQQEHFVTNLVAHLKSAVPEVRVGTIEMFAKVDAKLGQNIAKALKEVETKS